MSSAMRADLREIVRDRIESFRRKFGESGKQEDLVEFVRRDAVKQGWDADDLSDIDALINQAEVTIEIYVNFPDDEPPTGFRG